MLDARITAELIDPGAELGLFLDKLDRDGAVANFVGIARPTASDGAQVIALFLDHHPSLTLSSVSEISAAAQSRFGLSAVCAVHRYGKVLPGEAIVFVAAASPHRRAAFQAADYMMDRLKTEAIFWKREETGDRARWIEPTDADRDDVERWSSHGN